jgi:hypothetical protein
VQITSAVDGAIEASPGSAAYLQNRVLYAEEITSKRYSSWFETNRLILDGRSPFHQPLWLHAVEKASNQKLVYVGIFAGEQLIAAIPGFVKRLGPLECFGSPMRGTMTPGLGPVWFSNGDVGSKRFELAKACNDYTRKRWSSKYSEFCFCDGATPFSNRLERGWERRNLTSYFLDLTQGEKILWNKFRTRCRRHIRKTKQLGMEIVPLEDAHLYYRMLGETFGRRGTSLLHSEFFFRSLLDLVPSDILWAWGVRYGGNIIAAGIFVRDDQEVHYLSGASLSEHRALPTSYLLHWHAISAALEMGLRTYDLGGRGPTENLDLFKKSFDPNTANWSLLTHTSSSIRFARDLFVSALPFLRKLKRWLPGR